MKYEYVDQFEIRKDELSRAKDAFKYFIAHYELDKELVENAQTRVIYKLISHLNNLKKQEKELPGTAEVKELLSLPYIELGEKLQPHTCETEEITIKKCKICNKYDRA